MFKRVFSPVLFKTKCSIQYELTHTIFDIKQEISLEEIILAQRDEPKQKNCIFKLKQQQLQRARDGSTKPVEKYYQIRVKSIDFLQKSATAVYFYDFTNQIMSMELSGKLLKQEKRNEKLALS